MDVKLVLHRFSVKVKEDTYGDGIVEMSSQCDSCEWFKAYVDGKGPTCKAFPEGIPEAIWKRLYDHTKPFKGDGGIVYKHYE